jgi:hypothetical protein
MMILGEIKAIGERNSERLQDIEERLRPLEIEAAIARWQGKKWGAIMGVAVAAAAEGVRRIWG